MSATRQSRRWRTRSPGGAFGLCCLLIALPCPAAAPAEAPLCSKSQRIEVTAEREWRCRLDGTTQLIRIDRQRIDVTLALVGTTGTNQEVNSPTLRSGPELLLNAAGPKQPRTLVVKALDRHAPGTELQVDIETLAPRADGGALLRALTAVTSSAMLGAQADRNDSERRLRDLATAARDFRTVNRSDLEADAELRSAFIYYWLLGDWQKAADAGRRSMSLYAQSKDAIMESQAAAMSAASSIELAREQQVAARSAPRSRDLGFAEARRLLEGSAATFRSANMAFDEAHALNNVGLAYFYQGMGDDARSRYRQAVRLFANAGDRQGEALVLQNLAALEVERGNYTEAVAEFQALLGKIEPSEDVGLYVVLLNNYAVAAGASGQLDLALNALLTALPLTQQDLDPSHRARTLHSLGWVYLIAGDTERATTFMRQALELRRLETTHDRRGLLRSLIHNGELERLSGNTPAAIALHTEALTHTVSDSEKARALLALGTDQLLSGSVPGATTTFERALALQLNEAWPIRASLLAGLGHARMLAGDASGRELLIKASAAHRAFGDNELAAQDYYLLAEHDYRERKLHSALDLVQRVTTLYGSQRLGATNPELRAVYIATRADAYELQAAIYMGLRDSSKDRAERERMGIAALASLESLRLHAIEDFRRFNVASDGAEGKPTAPMAVLDAQIASKRHRLQTVLEQQNPSPDLVATLQRDLALLRSQLDVVASGPSARSIGRDESISLARIQESIEGDTALISWLPGEERSWIWCITKQHAEPFELPGRQKIDDAARELHERWSTPAVADHGVQAEQALSRVLLGDAATCLREHKSVVAVPDGLLRNVPVGALWLADAAGGTKRVFETHEVSYRPSLSSWQSRGTSPPRTNEGRAMLLIGDPVLPKRGATQPATYIGPTLRPLPGAGRELTEIAAIADSWRSVSLVREGATRTALLAQPLGDFRVIHFATHALLDVHDPQLSALILSSASSLTLRDVMNLRLKTDVVVLGACEAALGKRYRGQLSLGLSEAFLFAGSDNVLGSLWSVSDTATAHYMRAFYENYVRGETAAAAARTVALSMMRDPRYRDPFYWAPFVNLGS
jgi:CHAT domain-containing protein/tetratricopeptide (TPR) repeat protein